MARVMAAVASRSPRYFGKMIPRETASTWWLARPMRCMPLATEGGRLDLDHEVDGAHVDAELERRGGDEGGEAAGLERVLDLERAARGRSSRGGRGRRLARQLVEGGGQALGEAPAVHEDDGRAVRAHQLEQARVDGGPDRAARERRWPAPPGSRPAEGSTASPSRDMSSTGTSTRRSKAFCAPASTIVTGRGLQVRSALAAAEEARHLLERPLGGGEADALERPRATSSSSRSSESARCAPRFVPTSAWISSTITVSTGARNARACEVRRRKSDSGVVMRMSGGVRAACAPARPPACRRCGSRRPAGGRSRRGGRPTRAMPASGRPQVALDVHGQGLERRDVDDAAALGLRRDRARTSAGRWRRGRRPGSCPSPWARRRGRSPPSRSPASRAAAPSWAPRRSRRTTRGPRAGTGRPCRGGSPRHHRGAAGRFGTPLRPRRPAAGRSRCPCRRPG